MPYYKIDGGSKYFSENDIKFSSDWSPRNIGNIVFWGKPEKRYILRSSNNISVWKDNSGMMNDAKQENATNNPSFVDNFVNGYPSIYFQNDRFLSIPLTINTFTIFTVLKTKNDNIVYEFGDNTNSETGFYLSGNRNSIAVSNSGLPNLASIKDKGTSWLSDNTWKILTHQYNGTHLSHKLFINSVYQALSDYIGYNDDPGDITSTKMLNLGAKSSGLDGTNSYMLEFIVFDKYLSYTEITEVNNYLNNKYQIY
jgi:hypothetical protein